MTRSALVTGASSGLGRAVALELARRHVRVLLVARDEGRLAAVARDATALGGKSVVVPADVRDRGALCERVEAALEGQPLDLAVNAAGVLVLNGVESLTDDDFRECLEVNLLGSAHVVQATLPHLAATRGRLGLVVSITGLLALPGGFGAYAASKWGLRGYAETVRPELAARGVRLTLAFPSILDTTMIAALGPSPPPIYRAFAWHDPARAARALLHDMLRGRRESFVSTADWLAARAMRVAPSAFTAGLHAYVRWRADR